MNYRLFFRLSLLLPILVIGLFELGFWLFGPDFTKSIPKFFVGLWINTKTGLEIGIIQYIGLIAALAWGIGKWSLAAIKINAALTPLYYAAIMFVSLFIYGHIIKDPSTTEVGMFAAVFSIVYGYMYVLLVFLSYFVLRKSGVLRV